LLKETGRLVAAESLFRSALAGYVEHYGPLHEHTAVVQTNLAWVVMAQRRPNEADSLYEPAVAVLKERRPGSVSAALVLLDHGTAQFNSGKRERAVSSIEEGLAILSAKAGLQDNETIRARNLLGTIYARVGRTAQAESLLLANFSLVKDAPRDAPRSDSRQQRSHSFTSCLADLSRRDNTGRCSATSHSEHEHCAV
jgi:Flp pilus assembly protein TadD